MQPDMSAKSGLERPNLPCRLADGRSRTMSRKAETLSEEDIRIERLMLGLRTDRGLPQEELGSLADPAAIDRLLAEARWNGRMGGSTSLKIAFLPPTKSSANCEFVFFD